MEIAFIVTDQQKPHEGVVRPFVNFAKALEIKHRTSFFLFNCSEDFVNYFERNNFQVVAVDSRNALVDVLKKFAPHYIIVDDDLERLKLAQGINKEVKAKTVAYAQILYGSHAIANCFDLSTLSFKQRLLFSSMKYLPFSFFSGRYANVLKGFDLVLANSKVTATFLQTLYGVEVDGFVYPPVDAHVFQPCADKAEREVTLYLGSHLGDAKKTFIAKIVQVLTKSNYRVNLFGNKMAAKDLLQDKNGLVSYQPNLTDIELAQLYSRSKLTICPQKWEQFGYVPVESVSCGTPVLAFNCMGFQETIDKTTGWLADNERQFLQILNTALKQPELSFLDPRTIAVSKFSIETCGDVFRELLEKHFNEQTQLANRSS